MLRARALAAALLVALVVAFVTGADVVRYDAGSAAPLAYQPVAKVIPRATAPLAPCASFPDLDESTASPAIRGLAHVAIDTVAHESTSATGCYGTWPPGLSGRSAVAWTHRATAGVVLGLAVAVAWRLRRRPAAGLGWVTLAAVAACALHAGYVAPLPFVPLEGAAHTGLAFLAVVGATCLLVSGDGPLPRLRDVVAALAAVALTADAAWHAGARVAATLGPEHVASAAVAALLVGRATRGRRVALRGGLVALAVLLVARRAAVE